MSRSPICKPEQHVQDGWAKSATTEAFALIASEDYNDEVTQEDIDRIHAHARENFGDPPTDLVVVSGPAW